jgi:hypothetical protein
VRKIFAQSLELWKTLQPVRWQQRVRPSWRRPTDHYQQLYVLSALRVEYGCADTKDADTKVAERL